MIVFRYKEKEEKMKKYGYSVAEMLDKKTLEFSLRIAKIEAETNKSLELAEEIARLERIVKNLK